MVKEWIEQKNEYFYVIAILILLLVGCSSETNFTPPPGHKGPAITHYSFGKMVIDGRKYTNELQIFPDGRVKDWSPGDPHYILPADIEEIVNSNIQVLIIGNGANGEAAVPDKTINFIEKKNIKVHVLNSHKATELFNNSPKKNLAALFHLNC